jgi:diguanylate cyclase (GGDEF)-like protein
VTERVSAEEKLAHNALHDALTDLPNRRLFLDRLQRCHAQVRRDPGYHCAVMLADIDGFKALNHSLGSSAGDQLLIEIGLRLQSSLREGHEGARPLSSAGEFLLARFGGDEFAFLLEGCADENDVLRLAERAQAAVAAPLLLQQKLVRCTIGIGSAISSNSHTRGRTTRCAMRRPRCAGRRPWARDTRSHSMRPCTTAPCIELKLENELRTALNRSQFRVLYQPIFRIDPRQVVAFEALLRWQHPEQGLIAPNEFLAAAEETGLMAMIDQWVIREACGQIPGWQAANGGKPVRAAINLSARHFASPQLIDGIKACLRDTRVIPNCLALEIAEPIASMNPDHTAAVLAQMRRLGVTTALDDFGSNSISLTSLRRCSYEVLKIDRSLISSMQADRTSRM